VLSRVKWVYFHSREFGEITCQLYFFWFVGVGWGQGLTAVLVVFQACYLRTASERMLHGCTSIPAIERCAEHLPVCCLPDESLSGFPWKRSDCIAGRPGFLLRCLLRCHLVLIALRCDCDEPEPVGESACRADHSSLRDRAKASCSSRHAGSDSSVLFPASTTSSFSITLTKLHGFVLPSWRGHSCDVSQHDCAPHQCDAQ
jgi:hypothetical protein